MSVLPEAHDFVIHGGGFCSLTAYNHYGGSSDAGIDILLEAATPEVAFDAAERSYAASCFPGTREPYIKNITDWATSSNTHQCRPLLDERACWSRQLGGAFFFSFNERRKDHTRFFPTLAHQLSMIHPGYRTILDRKISIDKTLVKKKLSVQFKFLIVNPLLVLRDQGKMTGRLVILIDGLDERESQNAQVEVTETIASSIRNNSTPFRWAIFSGEEPHLVSAFAADNVSPYCHTVFLSVSRDVDGEIELYLRGGFTNILCRRNLLHLSTLWPTHSDIWKLVYAAGGLFAHSATILRFVDSYSYSGFKENLEAILAPNASLNTNTVSPYIKLDNLHTLILQRIPHDIRSATSLSLTHISRTGSNHWHVPS
ncbi:hypothetical protein NP233_g9799 [Leucocoprinus birnbaumii]|uniref:Nephrocystin 3-like N-terminal domain-containing protein n=1 Tax=Leucocoprinus birnbaumii TaxID=56174 RepID=A0AAD5YMU8_9AGAR|nr:hypothetical protein NP233_g9799 [Leucocoprinus birnbaumii]